MPEANFQPDAQAKHNTHPHPEGTVSQRQSRVLQVLIQNHVPSIFRQPTKIRRCRVDRPPGTRH